MDQNATTSVENPVEESATDYLRTHRIPDLFQNLSASLVYNRPGKELFLSDFSIRSFFVLDDPKAFILDYLEQLKKARASGLAFPALVQDNDLTSAFRLLDPAGQGYINYSQYASSSGTPRSYLTANEWSLFLAMEALGITNYNTTPAGQDKDRITSETFCQEA